MKLFEKKRVFMNVSRHRSIVVYWLVFPILYSPGHLWWGYHTNHPIRLEITPAEFCKTDPVLNCVTRRQGPAWLKLFKWKMFTELRSRVWFNSQFPRHLLRNKVWQGAGAPLDLFLPSWMCNAVSSLQTAECPWRPSTLKLWTAISLTN